jgi:hydrogenase 3 maturation protease
MPDLDDELRQLLSGKKAVIMGVGNPDRGDDALGVLLSERIRSSDKVVSITCEDLPENFTGVAKAENPDVILFIDAVDFGGSEGDIILVNSDSLKSDRFSSHRPSLKLVMDYLSAETRAAVYLLGVQPGTAKFGKHLGVKVRETLSHLLAFFSDIQKDS